MIQKTTSIPNISLADGALILDLETLSLNAFKSPIVMMGMLKGSKHESILDQWILESPEQEEELLRTLQTKLQQLYRDDLTLITYNGTYFDLPYLKTRSQIHGLSLPLFRMRHRDLYSELRTLRRRFSFPDLKLRSVASAWEFPIQDPIDSAQFIEIFEHFWESKDALALEQCVAHNAEDLIHTAKIFEKLSNFRTRHRLFFAAIQTHFLAFQCIRFKKNLRILLRSETPIPAIHFFPNPGSIRKQDQYILQIDLPYVIGTNQKKETIAVSDYNRAIVLQYRDQFVWSGIEKLCQQIFRDLSAGE